MAAPEGVGWQVSEHAYAFGDAALAGNEERFRQTFTHAPLAQAITDLDGNFVVTNERWQRCVGYEPAKLLTMSAVDLTHPEDVERGREAIRALITGKSEAISLPLRYVRADGEVIHTRTSVALVRGDDGRAKYLSGIVEDITAHVWEHTVLDAETAFYQAASEDKDEAELFAVLVDVVERLIPNTMGLALVAEDDNTLTTIAAPSLTQEFRDALVDIPIGASAPPCGRAAFHRRTVFEPDVLGDPACERWWDGIKANAIASCWSVPIVTPGGRLIGTFAVYKHTNDGPTLEQRELVERLARFAGMSISRRRERDALGTDAEVELPNRSRLLEHLGAHTSQFPDTTVFVLELVGFDDVLAGLGRAVGVGVLRGARDRIRSVLDSNAVLASLGGGRFAVARLDPRAGGGRTFVADVAAAFARPLIVQGFPFHLAVRIGVAEGETREELVEQGEIAVAHARETHQQVVRFHPGVEEPYSRRLAFAHEFRKALEGSELYLNFQPKFVTAGLRPRGVECLVRWRTADGVNQSPAQFVPLAEQTGLMTHLTRFVLRAAADQWREWQRVGIDTAVAVNVSGSDIGDPAFEATLREVLAVGLPPQCLEIEITEDAMMAQPEKAVAALRRLRARGITITIDDFGVGHSSLAYLRHFPIDVLKIDRSFILGLEHDPSRQAIVTSIVALSQSLGLRCVAEGVETAAALEVLGFLGCDEVQGYHLAMPMDAADAAALLAKVSA